MMHWPWRKRTWRIYDWVFKEWDNMRPHKSDTIFLPWQKNMCCWNVQVSSDRLKQLWKVALFPQKWRANDDLMIMYKAAEAFYTHTCSSWHCLRHREKEKWGEEWPARPWKKWRTHLDCSAGRQQLPVIEFSGGWKIQWDLHIETEIKKSARAFFFPFFLQTQ